jgi:hypothetical protein
MTFAAPRTESNLLSRRQLLKGAGGAAGLALIGGGVAGALRLFGGSGLPHLRSYASSFSHGAGRDFVSRPDLHPPVAEVVGGGASPSDGLGVGGEVGPGYVFLGTSAYGPVQAGSLLVDRQGEPAWFLPATHKRWMTDVRLQQYRDQPVLTWWEGQVTLSGFGRGEGVIMDRSYREIARVRAARGRAIDMHEFVLTPSGTALFTCCPEPARADLTAVGGPADGSVLQGIVQEVDVATGRLVFEWRSLEHIPVGDSYFPFKEDYDYLHANSIELTPDGHLLVSARHTWALYKLDRRSGDVIWRLGGKSTDFDEDDKARFAWQHDARQPQPGVITVFDDGAAQFADGFGEKDTESQSRGVALDVDEGGRKVTVAQTYLHSRHPQVLSKAMGNMQTLPDGNVLIGWGDKGIASEYTADGRWLADLKFGNRHDSYRAYKYPWRGAPLEAPSLAVVRGRDRTSSLYVSWNGATDVSGWIVSTGLREGALRDVGIALRRGFETVIPRLPSNGVARVTAVDAAGRKLRSSGVVRL